MTKPAANEGMAWQIACNDGLLVRVLVASKCILLQSQDSDTGQSIRIGYYADAQTAKDRAVELTGTYERLRSGIVTHIAPVTLPADAWKRTLDSQQVEGPVWDAVMRALQSAPI